MKITLPSATRRNLDKEVIEQGVRVWAYSLPFVGKTTWADKFPDPINLNTDGNIKYVTMPYVTISEDAVPKQSAWETFIAYVDMLTAPGHEFKTVVVDLLEDIYQFARDHHNKQQGWTHESEEAFAKGYDLIRNDFYGQIRRLTSSGLNVVLLSHEVEKIVKSRTGKETSSFGPNLTEKVALKVAGMVDVVTRASIDVKDTPEGLVEERIMQLAATSDQFTGGRLKNGIVPTIPLDYDTFMEVLKDSVGEGAVTAPKTKVVGKPKRNKVEEAPAVEKKTAVKEDKSENADDLPITAAPEKAAEGERIITESVTYLRHDGTDEVFRYRKGEDITDIINGPEIFDYVTAKEYREFRQNGAVAEKPVAKTTRRRLT